MRGGRVLFPFDGEKTGMFICLHINKPSGVGGGGGRVKVLLLEILSCEAIRSVNSLSPQGHSLVCDVDAYS